jgi:asparagine synthase (glutamine-hydrolysing)
MLSIPPEQHFRPHPATDQFYAGSKRLVREGLRGILPDSIRTLTAKTGFGSVFAEDISRNWSTYQTVFARQGRSHLVERGYLDHARFWTRLQQLRDGARGGDFVYLIRVLGLETWLRGLSQARGELVSVPAPWRTQTSVSSTAISTADEVILATS